MVKYEVEVGNDDMTPTIKLSIKVLSTGQAVVRANGVSILNLNKDGTIGRVWYDDERTINQTGLTFERANIDIDRAWRRVKMP